MRIKNNPLTLLSTKKALQLLTTTLFKVFIYRVFYLPIQKFANILPNNSSFVTCPVISPK